MSNKIIILAFFLLVLSVSGFYIFDTFFAAKPSDPIVIAPVETTTKSSGDSIYSKSVMRTRDTQRKSGASQIAFALKAYQIESPLPASFPSEKTCIGITPPCYNLVPLLVPDQLENVPTAPGGTEANTGFFVWREGNEIVVGTQGELEENIEVRK